MKKILSLFLALLLISQGSLAANNMKRFEITVTDFFFPFLSAEQNKALQKQILDDKLTIAGAYLSRSRMRNMDYKSLEDDVGYICFWNCQPLSHSTQTKRKNIIRRQQATIIAINPQKHQVIFELPADIKGQFLLDTIYFAFPLKTLFAQAGVPQSSSQPEKQYMELHIPVTLDEQHPRFNHYKMDPRLSFSNSSPPYSGHIYLEDKRGFGASLGMAVNINLLDENNTPLPVPLLPDFAGERLQGKNTRIGGDVDSIRLFGPTHSATYSSDERNTLNQTISFDHSGFSESNLVPVTLTGKMPAWNGMKNTKGEFINLGHIKIIRLQGELPYELGKGEYRSEKSYRVQETWIKTGNQVVQVHGRPDKNWSLSDHCYFSYYVTFNPDGDKQLYFTRDERNHVFFTPLSHNDISPLLDFEKRKKEMMFKMPGAIKACLQRIDHTKDLFKQTDTGLANRFTAYQKAIENAQ